MARGSQQAGSAPDTGNDARLLSSNEVVEVRREDVAIRYNNTCNRVLRVLVADDNADAADSLAILVGMWGHHARVVYDGAAALDMTFADHPDVLLLDIAMPEMDGFRLARVIRQQPRFTGAVLVAISGYADEAHRLLGKEAGFDHYLVKPAAPMRVEKLLRFEKERLTRSPPGPRATPRKYTRVSVDHEAALVVTLLGCSGENAGVTGT